jgi:hypothetical protein
MTQRKTTFCYVTLKIEQSTRDHHNDVLYQADEKIISSLEVAKFAKFTRFVLFYFFFCVSSPLILLKTSQNQQAV